MTWRNLTRPGMFGKRKNEIIQGYNEDFGSDGWRLVWIAETSVFEFEQACINFYEESYRKFFTCNSLLLDEVASYKECYDNNISNIQSGYDYTKQEAHSTHIQDVAIRNVLKYFGMEFNKNSTELLEIRSKSSNGAKFSPGRIPFFNPDLVTQPSLKPKFANLGSVEDFWQSNKWVQIKC